MPAHEIPRAPWYTRRPWLVGCLAMVCALCGVVAHGLTRDRPHLVLIVVDSLRADARSPSPGAAATPNLDRPAREGLVFHEAFAHSSADPPALLALLSARQPHEARAAGPGRPAPAEATLLAEHLLRRGYQTRASLVGPSSGPSSSEAPGLARAGEDLGRGFERLDAHPPQGAPGAARRASRALEGLVPRKPLFLLVHVADPRGPFEIDAADPGSFVELRAQYRRAVEEADRAIGALLDELRRRGLYDRSLIVVTSNHGQALGEHGVVGSAVNLHDAMLRVPLILRLPQARASEPLARLRHRLVRHVDVVPTLLELLHQPPLPGATGRSLFEPGDRLLLAETRPPQAPATLFALRDASYKLVLDASAGKHSLFRLSSDPLELDDVFSHQGHLRSEWQRELAELAGPRL
jgi:choline-sulfatase